MRLSIGRSIYSLLALTTLASSIGFLFDGLAFAGDPVLPGASSVELKTRPQQAQERAEARGSVINVEVEMALINVTVTEASRL